MNIDNEYVQILKESEEYEKIRYKESMKERDALLKKLTQLVKGVILELENQSIYLNLKFLHLRLVNH